VAFLDVAIQLLQLTRNCKGEDGLKLIIIKLWQFGRHLLNARPEQAPAGGRR
jgi:hypothetical protein